MAAPTELSIGILGSVKRLTTSSPLPCKYSPLGSGERLRGRGGRGDEKAYCCGSERSPSLSDTRSCTELSLRGGGGEAREPMFLASTIFGFGCRSGVRAQRFVQTTSLMASPMEANLIKPTPIDPRQVVLTVDGPPAAASSDCGAPAQQDTDVSSQVRQAARAVLLFAAFSAALLQLIQGLDWRHGVGCVFGGFYLTYIALLAAGKISFPSQTEHRVLWGIGFGFMLLLSSVHIACEWSAPDINNFPQSCRRQSPCVRVAIMAPQVDKDLAPLAFQTSFDSLNLSLQDFASSSGTNLIRTTPVRRVKNFQTYRIHHFRTLSPLLGFVDDLFVKTSCDQISGSIVVEAHSERRLTSFDFGSNEQQVLALWDYLNNVALRTLPILTCGAKVDELYFKTNPRSSHIAIAR